MMMILAISALATLAVTLGYLAYDIIVKRNPLLTYRNMFLVGYLFFYGLATLFAVRFEFSGELYTPVGTGYLPLAVMIPGFLVVFFTGHAWARKWGWPGKLIPALELPVTTPALVTYIVILLAVSSLGLIAVTSYAGGIMTQMRPGLAAAAIGLATYLLLAKRFNPLAWAIFIPTFVFGVLLSVSGGTDRRFVLGCFIVVLWVWYWCDLRFRPLGTTLLKLGVIVAIATAFIIVYSGIRHVGEDRLNFANRAKQLATAATDPTVKKGSLDQVLYQDAPINTVYIIETYPKDNDLDPFNGLKFFLGNPIPRFLWPDKPVGLGYALQQQFNIPANLGPGIIGHGWSEGMWLGVAGYAIVFGILTGIMDRLLRERSWNPYFLAVYGGFLGNFFGLSRGETSLFMVLIVTGGVGCIVVLWIGKIALGKFLGAFVPLTYTPPGLGATPYGASEGDGNDWQSASNGAWGGGGYGDPYQGSLEGSGAAGSYGYDSSPVASDAALPSPRTN
ncbi:MAG: hypothetical protein SFZ23_14135 [Planctomycetota bacterium]|nr:hypothetical protein [Planctomycetota bacterium]